jgi:hypothetical protein
MLDYSFMTIHYLADEKDIYFTIGAFHYFWVGTRGRPVDRNKCNERTGDQAQIQGRVNQRKNASSGDSLFMNILYINRLLLIEVSISYP